MQFSEIKVLELVSGNQATRTADAVMLKLAIEAQMAANNIVLVSLHGVEKISREFVDASFGALRDHYGKNIFSMYVKIIQPWVDVNHLPYLGWNTDSSIEAAA